MVDEQVFGVKPPRVPLRSGRSPPGDTLSREMELSFRDRSLSLAEPRMMGVLNVTPDSFYDGGATADAAAAVRRGLDLVSAGAAIVDVGGMTAQPGPALPEAHESARVIPVLRELRAATDAVISVDTYRQSVAVAALEAGADLINDHTGLSDPALAEAVAAHGAGLVVTHLGLAPKAAQVGRYPIEPEQIAEFLVERAERAAAEGVGRAAILIDPGLGFGKTTDADLATLRALPMLLGLGYPLLLACSHKEVTAEPLGLPETNLEGTAAVVAVAAYLGVHVLRVHDLPFMHRVARMGRLMAYAAGRDRSGANSGTNLPPA
jgi:dihydropteroate synthase